MRIRAIACLLLLTGCGFFSRTKSRFYSFERIPAARVEMRGTPIAIEVVELPPGFDRREIVVRQPDLRLEVRERDQWSASLEPMVLHTLAFDLAARLPEGMVILPGQVKQAGPTRSIDLVVEDLSAGPESKVTLDARWILREAARESTHHERIEIPIPSLESTNIATGMSQAIATLSDRIIQTLGSDLRFSQSKTEVDTG